MSVISRRRALAAAVVGLAAAGCGTMPPTSEGSQPPNPSPSDPPSPTAKATGRPATTPASAPTRTVAPPPDPAKIKANELGVVPVMMYHRLTDEPAEYDITPKAFAQQLTRLFSSGYRPVDAADLATGRLDVPAGKTPVVLTFDDGSPHQFRLTRDGRLDPTCAAGILKTTCARFADCHPKATFYINKNPFGVREAAQQRRVLGALIEAGFSLGNHTMDHPDLAGLTSSEVQRQFAELQQLAHAAVPDAKLSTMALPFGVAPRSRKLNQRGTWHGTSYDFEIALLVGANPSPSPFAASFAPMAVPRIRASSWHHGDVPLTAGYWLDHLDRHPEQRYVSAGNPGKVTVPASLKHLVAPEYRHRVVSYEER